MAKKLSVASSEILEDFKRDNGEQMTFAQVKEVYPTANPFTLGALIRGLCQVVEQW